MRRKISREALDAIFHVYDFKAYRQRQVRNSRRPQRQNEIKPLWRYVNGIRYPHEEKSED